MRASRIYLGLLLGLMALGQLFSFSEFVNAVEDDNAVSAAAPALATLLIAVRLSAAPGRPAPLPVP